MQVNLEKAQASLEELQAKLETASEEEKPALQEQIAKLNVQIQTLQVTINTINSELEKQGVSDLAGTIKQIQAGIDTANKELENINTQIEDLNTLIAQDSENEDLKTQLKSLELQKEVVNLRLDKNINYGSDNYKSIAVQNYRMYMGNYIQSSQGKNLTDEDDRTWQRKVKDIKKLLN